MRVTALCLVLLSALAIVCSGCETTSCLSCSKGDQNKKIAGQDPAQDEPSASEGAENISTNDGASPDENVQKALHGGNTSSVALPQSPSEQALIDANQQDQNASVQNSDASSPNVQPASVTTNDNFVWDAHGGSTVQLKADAAPLVQERSSAYPSEDGSASEQLEFVSGATGTGKPIDARK